MKMNNNSSTSLTNMISSSKAFDSLASESIQKKAQVLQKVVQMTPQGAFTFFEVNTLIERVAQAFSAKASVNLQFSSATLTVTDDTDSCSVTFAIGRGLNSSIMDGLDKLVCEVEVGRYSTAHDILVQLDAVKNEKYYFGPFWDILWFAVLAASIPAFFAGGSFNDIWVAGIFGGVVGFFSCLPMIVPSFGPLVDFIATLFVSTFVSLMVTSFKESLNLNFFPIWIGAVIFPIPGFSLAMGILEIAAGHTLQGAAQLMRSATCGLSMAVATYVGIRIGGPSISNADYLKIFAFGEPMALPYFFIGAIGFALAIALMMRARIKLIPLIVLSTIFYSLGFRFASDTFPLTNAFVGVLILYIICQWVSQLLNQPLYASLFICMLPYCPGSMFVRGILFWFTGNYEAGTNKLVGTLLDMTGIAFAMLVGKFLFSPILPFLRKIYYENDAEETLA